MGIQAGRRAWDHLKSHSHTATHQSERITHAHDKLMALLHVRGRLLEIARANLAKAKEDNGQA